MPKSFSTKHSWLRRVRRGTLLFVLSLSLLVWGGLPARAEGPRPRRAFLPAVAGGAGACARIPTTTYQALLIAGPPSDRPAVAHPDLNLALRGYTPTPAHLGLIEINGPADPAAPQLAGLFAPRRTPAFLAAQRVYDWDWGAMRRGPPIGDPPVTLIEAATAAGEVIHTPEAGRSIGSGYVALVLYASAERITLKYTREDNVVYGYTLHLESVCVEPRLLALYQQLDRAGRRELPALSAGQPLGRARHNRIGFAIRDCGRFLDPRSRKDWWQR